MIKRYAVLHRPMMAAARTSRDARASVSRKNHLRVAPHLILALTLLHLRMRTRRTRRMGLGRLKIRVQVLVGVLVQTVGSTRVCEVKSGN